MGVGLCGEDFGDFFGPIGCEGVGGVLRVERVDCEEVCDGACGREFPGVVVPVEVDVAEFL